MSRKSSSNDGQGGAAALAIPALLVLVGFPLLFIVLQAIFPHIGRGILDAPFGAVAETFADDRLLRWTGNTIVLGLAVVATSALVGIPLGVWRGFYRLPGAWLWDILFLVPFTIPPYIAALGWILALQPRGYLQQLVGINLGPFLFSFWGVVFVMTLNVFPVVYFAVSRTVASMSGRFVEAARVSGASPTRAWWRIVLPLSLPAIGASLLLVFAMTIEEFGTPAVLAARSGFLVLVTGIEQRLSDYPIDLPGAAILSLVLVCLALAAFIGQARLIEGRDVQTVSGRPSRLEGMQLRGLVVPVLLAFAVIALVATVVPVASVLVTASTRTIPGGLSPDNFSLRHFEALAADSGGALKALTTSLGLGIAAALITGALGLLTALVTVRGSGAGPRVLDFLSLVPNTIPGVVVAVGLILAWNQPWLPITAYNTIWVLILAYCCLLLPYPVRYATAALRQVGPSLEDAARVAGAGPRRVLLRVVLPLVFPSMLAAMLLVFAVAARELVATILLAPLGTNTVAIFIWKQFEQGSIGLGMAMSTVAIVMTLTVPALVALVAGTRNLTTGVGP